MKFTPDYKNIKPLGRAAYMDNMLWLCYSGSGAEFTFTGKRCKITFKSDDTITLMNNEENYARIGIFVYDKCIITDTLNEAEKTYTVCNSGDEPCVVRIVKLSETAMSTCAVLSIEAESIERTADKEKFIEFIGDSITCGYGVDDENALRHFVTATEDVTKAYAYKTAKLLDFDYAMASISGYGIISGYTGDGKAKIPEQTIPQYYEKMGFSYAKLCGKAPQDILFDKHYTPDVVVINLGTNDDSYTLDFDDRKEDYKVNYIEFLKQVRAYNENAEIVCVLGIMGQRLFPTLDKAVSEYKALTNDDKIRTMMLDEQLEADGRVADYHPTDLTHTKASVVLADFIRKNVL